MITEFTPIESLFGGALIGLATFLLLHLNGRVAGISSILGSVIPPDLVRNRFIESAAFIVGLLVAIPMFTAFTSQAPAQFMTSNVVLLVAGGLLSGFGVTMANGCTSGHGVCGISRLSVRSIIATLTFMAAAAVTVFILRHMIGA